MFKKRWRIGMRCSKSAGEMDGCVQEVLYEWKEVFEKCWRSLRRFSKSVGRSCSGSAG